MTPVYSHTFGLWNVYQTKLFYLKTLGRQGQHVYNIYRAYSACLKIKQKILYCKS